VLQRQRRSKHVKIPLRYAHAAIRRVRGLPVSINQKNAPRSQNQWQMRAVGSPAGSWQTMITADIQHQVILRAVRPLHNFQLGSIARANFSGKACFAQLLARRRHCPYSKIDPGDRPPGLCQADQVRPGATANVQGITGWVLMDKLQQFRRRPACIPGWLAKIPEIISKPVGKTAHMAVIIQVFFPKVKSALTRTPSSLKILR